MTKAYRRNAEVLLELLPLKGARVFDVGCGDGALARQMAQAGAQVTGLECSPRQLAKAHAAEKLANCEIIDGVAQSIPAPDASVDIVVFMNSLHHVPVEHLATGLKECARVLKPNGILYVCEPVADGPHFELARPIDDETEVRALALDSLHKAQSLGLAMEREERYSQNVRYGEYESFRDRMASANMERDRLFAEKDALMRARFAELARRDQDGFEFDQPVRVNILRKK